MINLISIKESTMKTSVLCGCLFAITGALATSSVWAATISRTQLQNGAGSCQSALPVFDGNIRKRPLGIGNEGSSAAFVSCSLKADDFYRSRNKLSGVGFANHNASAVTVNCTLVGGTAGVTAVTYFPKSISVPGNLSGVVLPWDTSDNGGAEIDNTVNFSCQLPVGIDINFIFTNIDEDIGA
jgi:hypothetical protein